MNHQDIVVYVQRLVHEYVELQQKLEQTEQLLMEERLKNHTLNDLLTQYEYSPSPYSRDGDAWCNFYRD